MTLTLFMLSHRHADLPSSHSGAAGAVGVSGTEGPATNPLLKMQLPFASCMHSLHPQILSPVLMTVSMDRMDMRNNEMNSIFL